jgi:hypothetical protein
LRAKENNLSEEAAAKKLKTYYNNYHKVFQMLKGEEDNMSENVFDIELETVLNQPPVVCSFLTPWK